MDTSPSPAPPPGPPASTLTILHDFVVRGAPYRIASEGSTYLLFRCKVDRFGTQYAAEEVPGSYGQVLGQMASGDAYHAFSSADWPPKWRAISTETLHGRHIILSPNAAVEICGDKAKAYQKAAADGASLVTAVERWEEMPAYRAQQWFLQVMRMMLEIEP